MITKELKVNDYVISAKKDIYRVIKVNKRTYIVRNIKYHSYTETIRKDGTPYWAVYGDGEFFECDNVSAKLISQANKLEDKIEELKSIKEDIARLFAIIKGCISDLQANEEKYKEWLKGKLSYERS